MSMCGHSYSTFIGPGGSLNDTAYVRNEGQRTWLRRSTDCSSKEYLMYDYSLAIGDTVYAGLNMDYVQPDTAMFVLQNIDTVQLSGIARRRFLMKYDRCNDGSLQVFSTMYWIEGVGSTTHPFYPVECICDFCEQGLLLLCCDSSDVQLYMDPSFNTCDTIISAVDEHQNADMNPLSTIYDAGSRSLNVIVDDKGWTWASTGLSLTLMAADGRIIQRRVLWRTASRGVRMDLASVASGVYVLTLSSGNDRPAVLRVVVG